MRIGTIFIVIILLPVVSTSTNAIHVDPDLPSSVLFDQGNYTLYNPNYYSNYEIIQFFGIPDLQISNLQFDSQAIEIYESPNTVINGSLIEDINPDITPFGIFIEDSPDSIIVDTTIRRISDHEASHNTISGIHVVNCNNVTILENSISDLAGRVDSQGILVHNSEHVIISNNTISRLSSEASTVGIYVSSSNFAIVTGNQVKSLSTAGTYPISGIQIISSNDGYYAENTISDFPSTNTNAFYVGQSINVTILDNVIEGEFGRWIRGVENQETTCMNNSYNGERIDGCSDPNVTSLPVDYTQFYPFSLLVLVSLRSRKKSIDIRQH